MWYWGFLEGITSSSQVDLVVRYSASGICTWSLLPFTFYYLETWISHCYPETIRILIPVLLCERKKRLRVLEQNESHKPKNLYTNWVLRSLLLKHPSQLYQQACEERTDYQEQEHLPPFALPRFPYCIFLDTVSPSVSNLPSSGSRFFYLYVVFERGSLDLDIQ